MKIFWEHVATLTIKLWLTQQTCRYPSLRDGAIVSSPLDFTLASSMSRPEKGYVATAAGGEIAPVPNYV